ncbi:MAG: peptidylprolyl isomerase [Brevundimonas sp.]|uniref:peptidylprolyl isomerase n=1 Tax=Brevundimonas sp. TaxID=1871086 RepID=UPI00271F86F2|nr:peptidylprolyl isomerase [Brevundimonas sp.]MDO9589294.1 peptidylprolyl isomerase [Brevundimonas sp.]MDP3656490.1 peptidylprolyl isomerase [Brevundimonas sp.]
MSAVIVVDGVALPERLVAEEAQNHPAATPDAARKAAAHALAIKALLLDRAHQLGLTPRAERDEDGREETPEEALVRAVLDAEIEVERPGEVECRRVYDGSPERFRTPSLTQASHILCAPKGEDEAAWEAAHAAAMGAIAELADHPHRFAELARDLSDCPSKGVGGSLGQLSPGDLAAEVEAGLDRLQDGETASEPVRSRFGWHVLRLERRIEGRQLPFEHVEPRIALHLESRAWTAAATRYVSGLAAEARERGVALSVTEDGGVARGALSLGDLLNDQSAVTARLEIWLNEADPALAAQAREIAAAAGVSLAEFVQREISGFIQGADDQGWTRLISAAQGSDDPALACVRAILKSKLTTSSKTFTLIRRH